MRRLSDSTFRGPGDTYVRPDFSPQRLDRPVICGLWVWGESITPTSPMTCANRSSSQSGRAPATAPPDFTPRPLAPCALSPCSPPTVTPTSTGSPPLAQHPSGSRTSKAAQIRGGVDRSRYRSRKPPVNVNAASSRNHAAHPKHLRRSRPVPAPRPRETRTRPTPSVKPPAAKYPHAKARRCRYSHGVIRRVITEREEVVLSSACIGMPPAARSAGRPVTYQSEIILTDRPHSPSPPVPRPRNRRPGSHINPE